MEHSRSDFHISGAYMSCWSPLSALVVGVRLADSSSTSQCPFDWRVSTCPSVLGPDVNCGHGRGRVVVCPRAAEVALAG